MRHASRPTLLCLCLAAVAACGGTARAPATEAPVPSSALPSSMPEPSDVPSSPSVASVMPIPSSGPIEPGRYRIGSPFPVTLELAVEDGWSVYAVDGCCALLAHRQFEPPGLVMFSAWTVDAVYADPCRHVLGPPVGSGVDALVAALRAVPALGAGAPTQTTVGGLPATRLTLQPGDDLDPSACVAAEFAMWAWNGEVARYVPPGYAEVADELWIVEVDGRPIVLDGSLSEATEADRADLDAIVASLRFP